MPRKTNAEVPAVECIPRNARRGNSLAPANCPSGTVTQGNGYGEVQPATDADRHRPRTAFIIGIIGIVIGFPDACHCCVIGLAICGSIALLFVSCLALLRFLYLNT